MLQRLERPKVWPDEDWQSSENNITSNYELFVFFTKFISFALHVYGVILLWYNSKQPLFVSSNTSTCRGLRVDFNDKKTDNLL